MGGIAKAITSGEGTPWGAPKYANAQRPDKPDYVSDPNQYKSYDTMPEFTQQLGRIGQNQQSAVNRQKMQAGANMSARDAQAIGRSLEGNRQMNQNDLLNNISKATWADKQGQMNAQNAFNANMFNALQNQYATDVQLQEAEKAQRRGMLSGLFGKAGDFANALGNF